MRMLSWDAPAGSPTVAVVGKRTSRARREHVEALLRDLRVDRGVRQVDLAGALGRPQSYVSKYENGERRLDIYELHEVCQALGISFVSVTRQLDRLLR